MKTLLALLMLGTVAGCGETPKYVTPEDTIGRCVDIDWTSEKCHSYAVGIVKAEVAHGDWDRQIRQDHGLPDIPSAREWSKP